MGSHRPPPIHPHTHTHDPVPAAAAAGRRPPRPNFHLDLPSPRVGAVPPALSPLDAFAMQSRLLAKQFEQEQHDGRRISRLPPVLVQREFRGRPEYFRNVSAGSSEGAGAGLAPGVDEDKSLRDLAAAAVTTGGKEAHRPMSHYPLFGHASKPSRSSPLATPSYDAPEEEAEEEADPDPAHAHAQGGYFGLHAPRAASPEPVDPRPPGDALPLLPPSLTSSMDSIQSSQPPRTFTDGSQRSLRSERSERGLHPPPASPRRQAKAARSFASIRSVPAESGDEEGLAGGGRVDAQSATRKFSSTSHKSRPESPFGQQPPPQWSPSTTASEYAAAAQTVPHKQPAHRAFNFSRPLSSGGRSAHSATTRPSTESRRSPRTSTELPYRQASGRAGSDGPQASIYFPGHSRHVSRDDAAPPTPGAAGVHVESPVVGHVGDDYFRSASGSGEGEGQGQGQGGEGAGSYIYTKYALPRGRAVERESVGLGDSWSLHQFSWDGGGQPQHGDGAASARDGVGGAGGTGAVLPVRPSSPNGSENISGMRLSRHDLPTATTPAAPRSRSADPDPPTPHPPSPSVQTERTSDQTPLATPRVHHRSPSSSTPLTPAEHLDLGIQAHTTGDLSKSTYHLRLAALAGEPTGMLLYALACRHGWGMRVNPAEGVVWLRKAVDSAGGLDVDAALHHASSSPRTPNPNPDPVAEAAERRARTAEVARAVYELGIASMNGWGGCARDKGLAVRCYEVAGGWGDADALAEAGFCYTQGVGVRKDVRRGAMLYRRAAVLGMGMGGNSWIYKAKYMDDNPISRTSERDLRRIGSGETAAAAAEKPRSRARSIWGRKRDKT
ncbi:hypothetical protein LTR53_014905 [Teratosphaeriaceae sp. CCFEE 6253]|nr:hypothetical protein LTR53_014905 [Teratosphaeriaceae sp. CCFEE 6253]